MDGFLYCRRRETDARPRRGIRKASQKSRGDSGFVGCGMEMRFHGAAKSARRGLDEDGEDSRRGTFGDAGDQSAWGALQLPPGTNLVLGEPLFRLELEVAH